MAELNKNADNLRNTLRRGVKNSSCGNISKKNSDIEQGINYVALRGKSGSRSKSRSKSHSKSRSRSMRKNFIQINKDNLRRPSNERKNSSSHQGII